GLVLDVGGEALTELAVQNLVRARDGGIRERLVEDANERVVARKTCKRRNSRLDHSLLDEHYHFGIPAELPFGINIDPDITPGIRFDLIPEHYSHGCSAVIEGIVAIGVSHLDKLLRRHCACAKNDRRGHEREKACCKFSWSRLAETHMAISDRNARRRPNRPAGVDLGNGRTAPRKAAQRNPWDAPSQRRGTG